ncbi:MAG TPA: outer membrane beta-barrel protein, partial [Steroidobacteraceae bacterium]
LHHSETLHEDESRTVDDVRTTSGSVGLEYRTSEDDRVILEYRFADARFPHPGLLAGVPFNRDYDEDGARLRVRYAFSAKTSLQASFGYLRRDYPLSQTGDFSGNVWNASLQWLPGIKTQVRVSGWSELKAYLDAESDHFVAEGGRAEVRWAPTRKLAFSLAYSREDQEYVSESSGVAVASGRRDLVRSPQASLSYAAGDNLLLELSWRLEERESNVLPFDYDDRIALVALRLTF